MLNSQKMPVTNSGFTLIELMIAVLILGIVMAMGMSSYRVWIQNTAIRNVAESVLNGLQLARAEAVKRNVPMQFNFRTGSAWTVCQRPVAPGACPDPDDATTIQSRIQTEGASTNVTVTTAPAANTSISFNNLGQVDTTVTSFTQVVVDNSILSVADKRILRLVVNVGGSTRMCDPKFAYATDPRGC
ncbi:MAG: GspH/FimT family pseudopilin [Methylotenera sp.]|nr:GspH/FimT family pseudopilin [Methylotenera sp.]MDD4924889.1 GspH/FimT family pseudopilin [Methylotenera sp.]